MIGRIRDLVLALVLGGLAAVGGYVGHGVWADVRTPELTAVGDRVQGALDAFASGDRVYVAADAHDLVPVDVEARLESLAAASDIPVYVAVWERSGEAGYDGVFGAVGQLQRLVDEEAVFVLYNGPGDGIVVDSLDGPLLGEIPEDFNGDADRRLSDIVTAVGDARRGPTSDWDYWGGPGGAVAAGALFAAGTIPAVLLLIGLGRVAARRRFRLVGGWW